MRFDLSGCGAGLDEPARSLLEPGPLAESLGYDGLRINEEYFGQGSPGLPLSNPAGDRPGDAHPQDQNRFSGECRRDT